VATTNPADSSFWDDISQLLGKTEAGAASGRAAQGQYLNQRDALAARLYDIAQTAREHAATQNLATDKYRNSLAGTGAGEAVRGALIQNAQPASIDFGSAAGRIPKFTVTGGNTPASFTPETRAAGAALAAHGTNLLNNPNSAITQTPGSGVGGASFLNTPGLSPEPTAGFWDKAAGIGSIGAGLAGALAKLAQGSGGNVGDALKKLFGGGGDGLGPNIAGGKSTVSGNFDPQQYAGLDPETGEPLGRDPSQYDPELPGETAGASTPDDQGRDPSQWDPYYPGELDPYGG
jgi:hypothetical protein